VQRTWGRAVTGFPVLCLPVAAAAAAVNQLLCVLRMPFCCSPGQWMGPKRVVPPAFSVDDPRLPNVDAVLLSHNHYGK